MVLIVLAYESCHSFHLSCSRWKNVQWINSLYWFGQTWYVMCSGVICRNYSNQNNGLTMCILGECERVEVWHIKHSSVEVRAHHCCHTCFVSQVCADQHLQSQPCLGAGRSSHFQGNHCLSAPQDARSEPQSAPSTCFLFPTDKTNYLYLKILSESLQK